MSPFVISDADLAATTPLAARRRASTTAVDATVTALFADYASARKDGRLDLMRMVRDDARAIDPALVAELDGFDYPAAA